MPDDTRNVRKKWIINDEMYIVGDPHTNVLTLVAGGAAIEINGKDDEVVLSGSFKKMTGGGDTNDIIFQDVPLPLKLLPSSMVTPQPGALFNIPFKGIGNLVDDIGTMISMMV